MGEDNGILDGIVVLFLPQRPWERFLACELLVRCMAACNTNGVLRYYTSAVLNGEFTLFSHQQQPSFTNCCLDESALSELDKSKVMAPRIESSHSAASPMPTHLNGDGHEVDKKPDIQLGSSFKVDPLPNNTTVSISATTHTNDCTSTPNPHIVVSSSNDAVDIGDYDQHAPTFKDYQRSIMMHFALAKRLTSCSKRLFQLRTKSRSLLTRLVAIDHSQLTSDHPAHLPYGLWKDPTDTESSTDDDNEEWSTAEQSWLCTRSVVHSNWHWLQTEIKASRKCLAKLTALKHKLMDTDRFEGLTVDEEVGGCTRTTPYCRSRRTTCHNLASPKYARMLRNLDDTHCTDPYVRCQCVPSVDGPCILCCYNSRDTPSKSDVGTSTDVDLLTSACSLSTQIHPKLSIPADVQFALRLESRLAAFSPVHFQAHKATIHHVPPWDKPKCLLPPKYSGDRLSDPTDGKVVVSPRRSSLKALNHHDRKSNSSATTTSINNNNNNTITTSHLSKVPTSKLVQVLDLSSTQTIQGPNPN